MAKKQWRTLVLLLVVFALSSLLLAACSRTSTAGSGSPVGTTSANAGTSPSAVTGTSTDTSSTPPSSSSPSTSTGSCAAGTTVKTSVNNFEQSCITLKKGDTLKIVQDQTSFHIFDYGQWNGNTQQPASATAGAPALKSLQMSGPTVSIGPFTTAGTYHIYCTVHPGMNLTIVVH